MMRAASADYQHGFEAGQVHERERVGGILALPAARRAQAKARSLAFGSTVPVAEAADILKRLAAPGRKANRSPS